MALRRAILSTVRFPAAAVRIGSILLLAAACTGDAGVPAGGRVPDPDREWPSNVVIIDGNAPPSCSTCRIELEHGVTIDGDGDSLSVRDLGYVARDSRGRTYVTEGAYLPGARVLIYDEKGEYAGLLGNAGQGPGEYEQANGLAVGPGDTVAVLDHASLSLYTPEGEFVRRVQQPVLIDGKPALLRNGTVVMAGITPETRESRLPLHFLTADDQNFRSVGTPALVWPRSFFQMSIVPGGDSTVWILDPANYRLENFDEEGISRKIVVVRNPDVHAYVDKEEIEAAGMVGKNSPRKAQSSIQGAFEDAAGRVWVLRKVDAPGRDSVPVTRGPPGDRGGPGSLTLDYMDRVTTSILEVLDPANGELLARLEVPGSRYLANDGTMYRMLFDESGLIRLEFVSLRVVIN